MRERHRGELKGELELELGQTLAAEKERIRAAMKEEMQQELAQELEEEKGKMKQQLEVELSKRAKAEQDNRLREEHERNSSRIEVLKGRIGTMQSELGTLEERNRAIDSERAVKAAEMLSLM